MTAEERLHRVLKKIDELKASRSRLEGSRDQLVRQLAKHGCHSLEEARAKLQELKEERQSKEEELEEKLKELEAHYGV